jgi:hypothetical protein
MMSRLNGADYVRANVEFFDEPGSPQGAAALGNLLRDRPALEREPMLQPRNRACRNPSSQNWVTRRSLGPQLRERLFVR